MFRSVRVEASPPPAAAVQTEPAQMEEQLFSLYEATPLPASS